MVAILALTLAIPGIKSVSAAPKVRRVGLVVAYTPDDSITILDRDGVQYMFELVSSLKILPPDRANDLEVGVYVTIIAPNNVPNGKHIAVGIVIHPDIPAGFPIPTATFTPVPTDTLVPTETATEIPATVESPTEGVTATETSSENATPTGTLTVESPTPTEKPALTTLSPDDARSAMEAFMEWLAMLFRQILSG